MCLKCKQVWNWDTIQTCWTKNKINLSFTSNWPNMKRNSVGNLNVSTAVEYLISTFTVMAKAQHVLSRLQWGRDFDFINHMTIVLVWFCGIAWIKIIESTHRRRSLRFVAMFVSEWKSQNCRTDFEEFWIFVYFRPISGLHLKLHRS